MTRIAIRLHFGPIHRLGPGKVALLEAIDATGSISQAALELDMSYRRAWVLLRETNAMFREPVTATAHGGPTGGGATLTPFGRDVVERFRRLEALMAQVGAADLAFFRGSLTDPSASD
jgi:molybdate transport system regulatory protein